MTLLSKLSVAAIALGTVQGRFTDAILVSSYEKEDCHGKPMLDSGLGELPLIRPGGQNGGKSRCIALQTDIQSLKFHAHTNIAHNQWIDDMRNGLIDCDLNFYHGSNCEPEWLADQHQIPGYFDRCHSPARFIGSIDWQCVDTGSDPLPGNVGVPAPTTLQTALKHAEQATPAAAVLAARDGNNNGKDDDGKDDSKKNDNENDNEKDDGKDDDNGSDYDDEKELVPRSRKHYNKIGVWYKHPWRNDDICMMCYTHRELGFEHFRCSYGGKGDRYKIDCGPLPELVRPSTVTHWEQATETAALAIPVAAAPTDAPSVQKRSVHARVLMTNPWIPGVRICADAEWQDYMQDKGTEVKIHRTGRPARKCHNRRTYDIDILVPDVVTATRTQVKTVYQTFAYVPSDVPQA